MNKLNKIRYFRLMARHRQSNVLLFRQGEIIFPGTIERDAFAPRCARLHRPGT
jgi:4-hydroxyphenylpyruvate dioxygenase-like putative hemolysin